jgi:hypothetical protein
MRQPWRTALFHREERYHPPMHPHFQEHGIMWGCFQDWQPSWCLLPPVIPIAVLYSKIDNENPLKTPSISMHLKTFHHNQNDHDPFVIIQPTPFTTIHLRHIFTEKEKKQDGLESQHYRNKITDAWLQIGQTCRHKLMITNPNKMQNSLHNNRPLHRKCIQTDPSSPKSQAKKRTKTTPLPHRVSPSLHRAILQPHHQHCTPHPTFSGTSPLIATSPIDHIASISSNQQHNQP